MHYPVAMTWFLDQSPAGMLAAVSFAAGACVGTLLWKWIARLVAACSSVPAALQAAPDAGGQRSNGAADAPRPDRGLSRVVRFVPLAGSLLSSFGGDAGARRAGRQRFSIELASGALFALFVVAYLRLDCQKTSEVRPDELWRYGRLFYHLTLFALLIAATGTDLQEYVIPDAITLTGVFIGLAGATLSGDLQIIHLWVDWHHEIPGLRGPYIPEWISEMRHWHGLAWSAAGLLAGAALTWTVRAVSSRLIGREALGLGDVTLMAMIGSFVGWQPVVFVFLLAPLCGLVLGVAVRLVSSRTFIPYGPYLAAATAVVLFSWRWIWAELSIRKLFGDWPSLAILGGVALAALVVLLCLLRLYRAIPVDRRRGE